MLVNTNAFIKNGILKMGKGVVWLNYIKEGLAGKLSSQKPWHCQKRRGSDQCQDFWQIGTVHRVFIYPILAMTGFWESWFTTPHPPCMFTSSRILWEMWSSCCQGRPDLVGRNDVRSLLAPHVDHCFRFNLASPTWPLWPFNAIRWSNTSKIKLS